MKKIIIVCGSPRSKGVSSALASSAAACAKKDGVSVELVDMGKLTDVRPCSACDSCMKSRDAGCVIKDDLTFAVESARTADAVLLVGPVYWFSFSSQTKLFIDRAFYSMCDLSGAHLMNGKKLGLVLVYGDENPFMAGAVNALRSFQDMAAFMGAGISGLVYGTSHMPADAEDNRPLFESTEALVKKMIQES